MSEKAAKPPGSLKIWMIAVRPWSYSASVLPVVLGLTICYFQGLALDWLAFFVAVGGVLCFHTAGNLISDGYDFKRGLDQVAHPASGAVIRGLLTPQQVFRGAAVCLCGGVAVGVYLIISHGSVIFVLGLFAVFFAVGYCAPGLKLKHIGLGDLCIFLAFGPLPAFGSYWIQAGTFAWMPVLWSVPLALLTVGILHANNWRDIESDTKRNCRTFASLLGTHRSGIYYRFLVMGPFILVLTYLLAGVAIPEWSSSPFHVLLTFLAFPLAVRLARISLGKDTSGVDGVDVLDARTAQLQLLFGLLLAAAFVVARHF